MSINTFLIIYFALGTLIIYAGLYVYYSYHNIDGVISLGTKYNNKFI